MVTSSGHPQPASSSDSAGAASQSSPGITSIIHSVLPGTASFIQSPSASPPPREKGKKNSSKVTPMGSPINKATLVQRISCVDRIREHKGKPGSGGRTEGRGLGLAWMRMPMCAARKASVCLYSCPSAVQPEPAGLNARRMLPQRKSHFAVKKALFDLLHLQK